MTFTRTPSRAGYRGTLSSLNFPALALCGVGGFFGPAHADSERVWLDLQGGPEGASYVRIHEPTVPHAVATVTFMNRMVHNGTDVFEITYGDITVSVFLEFNVDEMGAERINVTAPPGYAAVPHSITVNEYAQGVVQIVEYLGS
jgi:hypothetical protein